MKLLRRLLSLPALLVYRFLYVPIVGALDDFKHRHDPPLPRSRVRYAAIQDTRKGTAQTLKGWAFRLDCL